MSREAKINELKLKDRIKELEAEVASLKKRLDDLRKAKNTTILKREREVLEVGAPFGRRESQQGDMVKNSELEKKLQEAKESRDAEMEALRKKFTAEMVDVKDSVKDCGHEEELRFLRQRNEALENENIVLVEETRDLRERVEALVTELSIKEAKWCETEEELNMKLKTSWAEKYKEWMAATEAKIADLQRTNELLRTYLKNSRPDGRDPTLPDPGTS